MGAKDKKTFLVRFWAEKEVKDYTTFSARNQVEQMKTINVNKRITTNTIFEIMAESAVMNIPGIVQLVIGLIYAVSMWGIFNYIADIKDGTLNLIALMVWITMFMATFRFPRMVTRSMQRTLEGR